VMRRVSEEIGKKGGAPKAGGAPPFLRRWVIAGRHDRPPTRIQVLPYTPNSLIPSTVFLGRYRRIVAFLHSGRRAELPSPGTKLALPGPFADPARFELTEAEPALSPGSDSRSMAPSAFS